MKKKLAVATTAVLAMTMCLSMTACKDKASVSDLLPKMKGSYSVSVTPLTDFVSGTMYSSNAEPDSNMVIIMTKTSADGLSSKSGLYNVKTNKFVIDDIPSSDNLQQIDNTLYASYNATSLTWTLYDSTKGVYASSVEGTIDTENDIFVCKDGKRIYSTPSGAIKETTSAFDKILTTNWEIGDYYLDGSIYNGVFDVYNEKGELKNSVNLTTELNISADAELSNYWTIGNKIFFQTERVLPEDEEEYDYYVEGDKIDLDTYSYDLKKGSGKELKKFEYVVQSEDCINDDTIIATVQKITDGSLSQRYIQSFNASGKVAVDLQKLVPGAIAAESSADNKALLIADKSNTVYVYEGAKRVATIPNGYGPNPAYPSDVDFKIMVMGDYVYKIDYTSKELNIYDFKGNSVLENDNVKFAGAALDNVIYSVTPEQTDINTPVYASYYIFDTEKGISTLIGTNSETKSYIFDMERPYCYVVADKTTLKGDIHFFENDTVITGASETETVFDYTVYDDENGKMYDIIGVEKDSVVSYYSIVVSYPYEK